MSRWHRNYPRLCREISLIVRKSPQLRLVRLGDALGTGKVRYPFFMVTSRGPSKGETCRACIAGGIHGDEPSGVWAIMSFLEGLTKRPGKFGPMEYTVFPCMNPFGFEHRTRTNAAGMDINRSFAPLATSREALLVHNASLQHPYDLFVCLHEDDETNGFYIYEVRRGHGPLYGADIVRATAGRFPLDRRPSIDSRINHSGILRPSNWGRRKTGWSQSIYFYRKGAKRCHIHEVPAGLPEQDRVDLHLLALQTLLRRLASPGSACGSLSSAEVYQ